MADVATYVGQFRTNRVLIAGSGFIPPANRKFDVLIPELIRLSNRKVANG